MQETGGATMVEFALILPVLLLGFLGVLELAVLVFLTSSVEGAIFEATCFGSTGAAGETVSRSERVLRIVEERTYGLLDPDRMTVDTLVYPSFGDIGQREPYADANGNGRFDGGEAYSDVNGNAQWDPDMEAAGLGGTGEVVLYRVSYAWGLLTPFVRQAMGGEIRQSASAAVRNEPF